MCSQCNTNKCSRDTNCRKKKYCCKSKTVIRQKDLPYNILTPGYYVICEDLTYDPIADNTSAINILVSGVVLDFESHRLVQATGNVRQTTAVNVIANLSDVHITAEEGSIQNFNGSGVTFGGLNDNISVTGLRIVNVGSDLRTPSLIFPLGAAAVDGGIFLGTATQTVSNVLIDHVTIIHTKNFGISLFMNADVTIQDSTVEDIYANVAVNVVAGILIASSAAASVQNVRGKNLVFQRNVVRNIHSDSIVTVPANLGTVTGVFLGHVDQVTVRDNTITDSATTSIGFFCTNWLAASVNNGLYEQNQFLRVFSTRVSIAQNFHTSANTAINGLGVGSGKTTIRNCIFSDATGRSGVAGCAIFYGQGWVVEDCQVSKIVSTGAVIPPFNIYPYAAGFFLGGGRALNGSVQNQTDNNTGNLSDITLKNCIAQQISTPVGTAAGFLYEAGTFNLYQESGVNPSGPTPTNPVICKNIQFIECKADDVSTLNGRGAGFSIDRGFFPSSNIIAPIYLIVLSPPYLGYIPYKSADQLKDVLLKDCIAVDCRGTATGSAGIVLSAVDNPIVEECTINDCTNGILLTGGTVAIGADFAGIPGFPAIPAAPVALGFTKDGLIDANNVNKTTVGYQDSLPVLTPPRNNFVDNISSRNTVDQVNIPTWTTVPYNNRTFL
jgi:hypothetical protein